MTLVARLLASERLTSKVAVVVPLGLAFTVVPMIEIVGSVFEPSIMTVAWLVRIRSPWDRRGRWQRSWDSRTPARG